MAGPIIHCLLRACGGCVSGRPRGSLGAVRRSTVRTTFKQLHDSNPLQSLYSQAWETKAHYVTAADAIEYLPPRDGITCLSIDSGPPGRPLLMNAISCHYCAEGNACKAANCSCNCVELSCNCVKLGFHRGKLS